MRSDPVSGDLLVKTQATLPQQGLSARQRRNNLHESFHVVRGLDPLRILLVDDVMATGTTVEICSRVLKGAGAAQVEVAVLARATL